MELNLWTALIGLHLVLGSETVPVKVFEKLTAMVRGGTVVEAVVIGMDGGLVR